MVGIYIHFGEYLVIAPNCIGIIIYFVAITVFIVHTFLFVKILDIVNFATNEQQLIDKRK